MRGHVCAPASEGVPNASPCSSTYDTATEPDVNPGCV